MRAVRSRGIGKSRPLHEPQRASLVAVQLLLYASPVAYAAARVPERWHTLYYLNPLVAAIEGLRWALLGTEAPSAGAVAWSASVAALAVIAGVLVFRRMERGFADVI